MSVISIILKCSRNTTIHSGPTSFVPPNCVQVGKAEKLKPMELELRRLEDLAESIVNDFAYMRAREEEMRDTNGEPCL